MTTTDTDNPTAQAANAVIEEAKQGCVNRGEGRGKCHVFVDHKDRCQCGERTLPKVRELK